MSAKAQRQLRRAIAEAIEESDCSTWQAFDVVRDVAMALLGQIGATMVKTTMHLPRRPGEGVE